MSVENAASTKVHFPTQFSKPLTFTLRIWENMCSLIIEKNPPYGVNCLSDNTIYSLATYYYSGNFSFKTNIMFISGLMMVPFRQERDSMIDTNIWIKICFHQCCMQQEILKAKVDFDLGRIFFSGNGSWWINRKRIFTKILNFILLVCCYL